MGRGQHLRGCFFVTYSSGWYGVDLKHTRLSHADGGEDPGIFRRDGAEFVWGVTSRRPSTARTNSLTTVRADTPWAGVGPSQAASPPSPRV